MTDKCICQTVATNEIGEVIDPHGFIIYRFALDCPIHGIVRHYRSDVTDLQPGADDLKAEDSTSDAP